MSPPLHTTPPPLLLQHSFTPYLSPAANIIRPLSLPPPHSTHSLAGTLRSEQPIHTALEPDHTGLVRNCLDDWFLVILDQNRMRGYQEKGGLCPDMFEPKWVPLSRIPDVRNRELYDYGSEDHPKFGANPPVLQADRLLIASRCYVMMQNYGCYEGPPGGIVYVWVDPDTQVDGLWTGDMEQRDCGHTFAVNKAVSFVHLKGVQYCTRTLSQADKDKVLRLGQGLGMQQSGEPVWRPMDEGFDITMSDEHGVCRSADEAFAGGSNY